MSQLNLLSQALAQADAETQGQFFNEFARLLKLVCKGRQDNQLCYCADYLDSNGREFVADLNEFARLAVENRAQRESEIQELQQQKHNLEKELETLREARETMRQLITLDAEAAKVPF